MNFGQQEFEEMAKTPIYENSQTSSLCAILLLNCCQTHNISNVFITELLGILKKNILRIPNTLLNFEYEAFKHVEEIGLGLQCD
jgi:hypothetical protein